MLREVKELRQRKDVVISRPDKGRAVVILNRNEYVTKMSVILGDTSKFISLGPVETTDNTVKAEKQLADSLKQLLENFEICEVDFKSMVPVGTNRPRMYGVPKIHKSGVPLRPILSVGGTTTCSISVALQSFTTCD